MNLAELKSKIKWSAPVQETAPSATLGELFTNCTIGIIKTSKNNAVRASLVLKDKDTGKAEIVVCSEDITPYVRSGQVTAEHLKGMTVVYNEKYESFFVGAGFVFEDLDTIQVKAFNRLAINLDPNELVAL